MRYRVKHTCFVIFLPLVFLVACRENSHGKVEFSHVAPIIYKNCTPCHRKGESAPFELMTYKDVAKRSKTILDVVEKHIMPPWPADPSYTHFVGEKVLTDEERLLIKKWVEAGAPLGDTGNLLPPPVFSEHSWLGKPDLTVKMPVVYEHLGNNADSFLLMKLPFELSNDTFIRAVEFVPGNRKIVHHVNGHLLRYEYEKKKNIFDGEKIVSSTQYGVKEAYEKLKLSNDDGTYPVLKFSFVNYLPGVEPVMYPPGIGGFCANRKNVIFFKDIHYGPYPAAQTDQSYVNIFFDSVPPKRQTIEMQLGTLGVSEITPPLVLPPNEIKTVYTRIVAPADMTILTINPHMHLLGKSFWAYALAPKGDTIPLIRIPKWDFRWQYFYTYKIPVIIPKGSVITAVGVYDNTVNNPNNPFHPPRLVSEREGSMRTTDEMFQFIITWLPYQKGDENMDMERR